MNKLAVWCRDNNVSLNVEKTKEIVVNFRRALTHHPPLTINSDAVERVSSTKFLGVHLTEDLSWSSNTASLARKAQQHLYFLRRLKRARAPVPVMHTFYCGTTKNILTSCITVWNGGCTASCRKTLQRIVRAAEKIIGSPSFKTSTTHTWPAKHSALRVTSPIPPTAASASRLPGGE